MHRKIKLLSLVSLAMVFSSCNFSEKMAQIEKKAALINQYELTALQLAKENRELKAEISRLQFEGQELKSQISFLEIQVEKKNEGRGIASVKKATWENDQVKYDVYKWSPSQLLAVAQSEFEKKNYEKSAQFYQTFMIYYPEDKRINDELLFQAGMSAFESGSHPDWAIASLQKILTEYPTSKFYRGAKLWMALTNLKEGKEDLFFATVEEFRKKYRNTSEWKILSAHYENIVDKYKK